MLSRQLSAAESYCLMGIILRISFYQKEKKPYAQ